MNNYHTRLKMYEQALSDYRWAKVKRFFGVKDEIGRCEYEKAPLYRIGLCWYFTVKYDEVAVLYRLPELMKQKPSNTHDWWFPQGALTPRIKVLKAAIKLTKHKMKGHAR